MENSKWKIMKKTQKIAEIFAHIKKKQ